MKSPPAFLKGQYRAAMRFAVVEADRARAASDDRAATRAWKLFLLLPRLLLYKPPRGGQIPKSRLIERFADFAEGRWAHLFLKSREWADQAAVVSSRRGRRHEDDLQRRADRAEALVQFGELFVIRAQRSGGSVVGARFGCPYRIQRSGLLCLGSLCQTTSFSEKVHGSIWTTTDSRKI